ncbi:Colicin V production protein [Fusobacterium necrogenes]|uniref:Colicin V production protein n=1 Tax=Fusobacterium necrogenes TaxID=858 RepID=A0A377GX84_9FUSO|nr:CvpA family protein [Fusobacterium necrogenes]STO31600.1 Colicin V production protein [Fusobacterium necrogenes]
MYLDIIILVVLILAILDGLKNGFFVEFLSVFGLVINFIAARYFTPILIKFLNLKSNDINYFIVYIVIFWAVYIVIGLLLHFLKNIMETLTKGFILRILGGLIGVAKGAVLALVVVFIFNFTSDLFPEIKKYGNNSRAVETLLKVAPLIEEYIPKVFKERIEAVKNEKLIDKYINKIF